MPSIHIENIGPITEFEFQMTEPGLYVLEGNPGAGKSTCIRTIQLVVDGRCDVKPTKRDGANRGLAEVAGKTVRISKTTRSEGDLSVEGLGDLSIVDLHSPKFQDAKTRDRHRIVTLCRLAGADARPELFYPLLGGRANFREIVSDKLMETTDLVEMATRTKSEIERECRRIEDQKRTAESDAKAQLTIAEGVGDAEPPDEQTLQRNLEDAIREHSTIKEKRATYLRTVQAADEARARLAKLPPGKSVYEASEAFEQAAGELRQANLQVARISEMLRDAEAQQKLSAEKERNARSELNSANSQVSLRGELDSAIEAASGATETTDDEVDDAAESVGTARRAVEQAIAIRSALKARDRAKEHLAKAAQLAEHADRLRQAAADTFEVLSNSIASLEDCPLRVRMSEDGDPRLVVATDRSDHEYFDELSGGEKWHEIMRIATRKNRLIAFPQEAFGELARSLRNELHSAAKAHGAFVITAMATDGELRGVPYVEQKVEAAE